MSEQTRQLSDSQTSAGGAPSQGSSKPLSASKTDVEAAPDADGTRDQGTASQLLLAMLPGAGRHSPPIETALAPASRVAGYEILAEVGRGAMGVVYKARQIKLDRIVALKMMRAGIHASPEQLLRFEQEARAVAQLEHPNIVKIHEIGEYECLPFLSLEYVEGETLARTTAHEPQRPKVAATLTALLARAMAHAHAQGIVHRDLKPGNILISVAGTPKIADFGLAKSLDGDSLQTRDGNILGTPSFMAPEQARGVAGAIGPHSDQYALGAILYELLTGRPPFHGSSVLETLEQVRSREPVPPAQLQPKVPRDLETICLKCLQKDPAKRFDTCGELADDLDRFLAGLPIRARPVSQVEYLYRWVRRRPALAALSLSVLGLLVAVAVASSFFAVRLRAEKHDKERERHAAVDAKVLAQDKEREARQSAELAQERQDLAVDSLTVVVSALSNELADLPYSQEARQRVLRDFLRELQKTASRRDESGLADRGQIAALAMMGEIARQQHNYKDARKHFEECSRLAEALYRAQPESDKAAGNLALVLTKLGESFLPAPGQPLSASEARRLFERAAELQLAIIQHPRGAEIKPPNARHSLADTLDLLGDLDREQGNLTASASQYEKARALRLEAVQLDSSLVSRLRLARTQLNLGRMTAKQGDSAQAIKFMDECLAVRREAAKLGRLRLGPLRALAEVLIELGDLNLFHERPETARTNYRDLLQTRRQLFKVEDSEENEREVSLALYRSATAALRCGDSVEADKQYRECLQMREIIAQRSPKNLGNVVNLMIARARCGQHDKALDLARQLEKIGSGNPGVLYQLACCHALCANTARDGMRQEHIGSAFEMLEKALGVGFSAADDLRHDPDLDALHDDPRFPIMLSKLSRKESPAPKP